MPGGPNLSTRRPSVRSVCKLGSDVSSESIPKEVDLHLEDLPTACPVDMYAAMTGRLLHLTCFVLVAMCYLISQAKVVDIPLTSCVFVASSLRGHRQPMVVVLLILGCGVTTSLIAPVPHSQRLCALLFAATCCHTSRSNGPLDWRSMASLSHSMPTRLCALTR